MATTTKSYQWTYGMVTNEYSFRKGFLRLESNMYILLGFLWHKQGHGVHVFHFLNIFINFDKCHVCINTYKFCLITIVTSHLYMFTYLKCEHCIKTLLKIALQIWVWNLSHHCTKNKFLNIKFNVKYLHRGPKININFVMLILQYPHLKHKMPTCFFEWFV